MAACSSWCRVAEGADGLGADEGDVAGEDDEVLGEGLAGEGEVGLDHLQGVAGAALLGLEDELDAGVGDGGADAVALVADDAVDLVGGDDGLGGGDDVEQERAAADLVKDLGSLALEPRALAGGHDGDCKSCSFHCASVLPVVSYLFLPQDIGFGGSLDQGLWVHSLPALGPKV